MRQCPPRPVAGEPQVGRAGSIHRQGVPEGGVGPLHLPAVGGAHVVGCAADADADGALGERARRWCGDADEAVAASGEDEGVGGRGDALVRAASNTEAPSMRTIPATGAPLRMGQLLTVVVGDDPDSYYGSSADGDGGYGYGNDGSVNVPGWACPTRWC